jgi:hypothetical protein
MQCIAIDEPSTVSGGVDPRRAAVVPWGEQLERTGRPDTRRDTLRIGSNHLEQAAACFGLRTSVVGVIGSDDTMVGPYILGGSRGDDHGTSYCTEGELGLGLGLEALSYLAAICPA